MQRERDTWRDAGLAAQQRLQAYDGIADLNKAELAEQRRRTAAAEAALEALRREAEDQQEQLRIVRLAEHKPRVLGVTQPGVGRRHHQYYISRLSCPTQSRDEC